MGIYDRSGAPVDRALLQALAHFLSYRGPDWRDTWSSGAIGLGHTMLRTTRESLNERQPASLDGQLWITADARIDCREELEKKLAAAGHGAAGRAATDSDLILHAYRGVGRGVRATSARRFCLRDLGRAEEIAVLRARSFRSEAFLLRRAGRTFSFQQHTRLPAAASRSFR